MKGIFYHVIDLPVMPLATVESERKTGERRAVIERVARWLPGRFAARALTTDGQRDARCL